MRLSSKLAVVRKLIESKKYRDAYVYEHVRNGVPFQIRALRDERGWKQGDLGDAAGKPRNVITRLEDPNYGKLTLKTLFEIASAFDVGLLVKFVPFSRLLREYEDVSPSALSATPITKEAERLETWAATKDKQNAAADSLTVQQEPETRKASASITERTIRVASSNTGPIQGKLFSLTAELQAVRSFVNYSSQTGELDEQGNGSYGR